MKIYVIDPWGINNTSHYLNGLVSGVSKLKNTDVVLFTNHYYKKYIEAEYQTVYVFFKKSEKMKPSKFRKLIRGAEYLCGQIQILKYIKKNKPDIIHINWLLSYKLDIQFLRAIKKMNIPVVYTAHDVVPHVNPDKYITELRTIYSCVDKIIVHGENLKRELCDVYHDFEYKIYVQHHGYSEQQEKHEFGLIQDVIKKKIESYDHIFIFFGNLFYAKGVDRVIRYWLNSKPENVLLVVCGKKNLEYSELTELEEKTNKCEGILYINHFVEDDLLNYLISNSDLILLPYRHASMSGVIFTAAEFSKTVLSTKVGAIPEYISDEFSFLTDNNDAAFDKMLSYIIENIESIDFINLGKKLHDYILAENSWDIIAERLMENVYQPLLPDNLNKRK